MANAEIILRDLLKTIVLKLDFSDYEIKLQDINSGGANYTSGLYQITIKNGQKQLDLFAKVASIGEKSRESMNANNIYKTEALVYNKLAKAYEELQEKHHITGDEKFVFPKFYGCNETFLEEAVILENLVAKGYYSFNRFSPIDWEHAASAVKSMAQFHALSFAYQRERPEEFAEIASQVEFQKPKHSIHLKDVWGRIIARSLSVVDKQYHKPISKFFEEGAQDLHKKFNSPMGKTVLIHGDYRPSNLMFKTEGDKIHTIPVDFQTLRTGSPANDLIYFIFIATDAAFRRQHYEALLEDYWRQLSAALARLGLHPEEVYPREEFDDEMKQMLPYSLWLAVAILPIALVQVEEAPIVEGEGDLSQFVVPVNEMYIERFRGIVDDCVRRGILKI